MHTMSTPIRLDSIPKCEHVKRAIEVAAVGDLSMTLCGVGRGRAYAELLVAAAVAYGVTITLIRPCLCGNLGDAADDCTCGADRVARFRRRAGFVRAQSADIYGEVAAPAVRLGSVWSSEPDEHIHARIAYARSLPRPTESDGAAQRLTQAAVGQLRPTHMQLARWQVVAGVIAQMAGARLIGAAHLAEAIQYRAR